MTTSGLVRRVLVDKILLLLTVCLLTGCLLTGCLLTAYAHSAPLADQVSQSMAKPPLDCPTVVGSNTLNITVPFAAGGGKDLLARGLAEQINREVGLRVLVRNVPGAMGAIAARSLKISGTGSVSIAMVDPRMLLSASSLGLEAPLLTEISPLMLLAREPAVWIVRHDAIKALSTGGRFLASSSEPNSRIVRPAKLLMQDIVAIKGYRGSADAWAALSRGEIDIMTSTVTSAKRYLDRDDSFASVWMILGNARSGEFPDAPTLMERMQTPLGSAAPVSEAQRDEAARINQLAYTNMMLAVDVGMPRPLQDCLRAIVDSVVSSKRFQRDMLALGVVLTPASVEQAQSILSDLLLMVANPAGPR